jgi:hypothetical protein
MKRHEMKVQCHVPEGGVLFFDSGWQCFLEQRPNRPMTVEEMARDAFYAGAALLWTGINRFHEVYADEPEEGMAKTDVMLDEVFAYLKAREVRIEWEPKA